MIVFHPRGVLSCTLSVDERFTARCETCAPEMGMCESVCCFVRTGKGVCVRK